MRCRPLICRPPRLRPGRKSDDLDAVDADHLGRKNEYNNIVLVGGGGNPDTEKKLLPPGGEWLLPSLFCGVGIGAFMGFSDLFCGHIFFERRF